MSVRGCRVWENCLNCPLPANACDLTVPERVRLARDFGIIAQTRQSTLAERQLRIRRLLDSGKKPKEIAGELGMNEQSVWYALRRMGMGRECRNTQMSLL